MEEATTRGDPRDPRDPRLAEADGLRARGRLVEAAELYRAVLAACSHEPDALVGLGLVALASGDHGAAAARLRAATDLAPSRADAFAALGVAQKRLGDVAAAIGSYRRSLALEPEQPATHANLARALRETGRLDEAIGHFRRAVELRREFVEAWSMLSNALREAGRLAEALEAARVASRQRPTFAEAHLNEGAALQLLGDLSGALVSHFVARLLAPNDPFAAANLAGALALDAKLRSEAGVTDVRAALAARPASTANDGLVIDRVRALSARTPDAASLLALARLVKQQRRWPVAAVLYERALALAPDAVAHRELGAMLRKLGLEEKAIEQLGRALALDPDDRESLVELGQLHLARGNHVEAERYLRRALAVGGEDPALLVNLGVAAQRQGRPVDASELQRRAIALSPDLAPAHVNLASSLSDQGRHQEAASAYRRALELAPDSACFYSNLLMAMHFDPTATPAAIFEEHRAFGRRFGAPLRASWPSHEARSRDPARRLRIGYVSPDLRQHPVAFFLEPVLRAHDRNEVELFAYADVARPDSTTERLRGLVSHWRATAALSDEALADAVRSDEIDILVDLAGHTANNRMLAFARKPAPVQASWIGYFDTTGLEAIDYRLADLASVPEGAERYFVERIERLPRSANCYLPPPVAVDVAPSPASRSGRVTFGCFNNPAKITRDVVRVFARILRDVEGSRLVLKYGAFDDAGIRAQYLGWFAEERIEAERVDLRGHSSMAQFLAAFADIDVALDPFPYSGETTALHTLWMGVPLVALEGETLVRRLATRVLHVAGLSSWVAASEADYVRLAIEAARDVPRLASLRGELRDRLSRSPLFDHVGVTRELERAFRSMWRRWCEEGTTLRDAETRSVAPPR